MRERDEQLLEKVNELFGGIVTDAYADRGWSLYEDGSLNLDSSELVLVFSNGRAVCFWNSEWGGLQAVTQ